MPLYIGTVQFTVITWKDHGKVGLDTWAHHFKDESGREFVLIYEDVPGSEYMADDTGYSVVSCGDETTLRVLPYPKKTLDNIFSFFTLYAESRS